MIHIFIDNIKDLNLPLDTTEKITKRGESKRILKKLEKKYNLKSHQECRKTEGEYILYINVSNFYVPEEEKELWIHNYEVYVRSSIIYKFWIAFYKICKFIK